MLMRKEVQSPLCLILIIVEDTEDLQDQDKNKQKKETDCREIGFSFLYSTSL